MGGKVPQLTLDLELYRLAHFQCPASRFTLSAFYCTCAEGAVCVPWWFAASVDLSSSLPYSPTPRQAPVCDVFLPVSMCSHCSTPSYEWEDVFGFLLFCQFADNDGFQLHLCPCKGHECILFNGCIVFHGVYVPYFLSPVYHWWAFGLVPSLCYCEYCCNEHMCACVFIVGWFIILRVYTQ